MSWYCTDRNLVEPASMASFRHGTYTQQDHISLQIVPYRFACFLFISLSPFLMMSFSPPSFCGSPHLIFSSFVFHSDHTPGLLPWHGLCHCPAQLQLWLLCLCPSTHRPGDLTRTTGLLRGSPAVAVYTFCPGQF